MTMTATEIGNTTQLVFCRENVDPDFVTKILDLVPSKTAKVGEQTEHENGVQTSHLGLWKLHLPNANFEHTVEDQIGQWIDLLRPKASALNQLQELGYNPYLDCRASSGSLSLCVAPELLAGLAKLNISLSVWLNEQPD